MDDLDLVIDHHSLVVVRYVGTGSQQMGVRVEGVSIFDSGNWTLTMMNANLSVVSTRFEVVVTEEPHLVTDTVLPIEVEVRVTLLPITQTAVVHQLSPLSGGGDS